MVANLLRKLAEKLRGSGSSDKDQKLKGIDNPGTAPESGTPNPVGSYTDPPKPPKVDKPSTGTTKGWKPKIPTTWRKL
jgi:hypothetical protein